MKNLFTIAMCSILLLSCSGKEVNPKDSVTEIGGGENYERGIRMDKENFPDIQFRGALCRKLPIAEGDIIPEKYIKQIIDLDLRDLNIKNLKGIEFFTSLKQLDCSCNMLTEIDVSKNIALKNFDCGSNQLSKLDVSHNLNLSGLGCSNNHLSEIDVSQNKELEHLLCNGNNKLSEIDVSHNPKLKELGVVDCDLKVIDVTKNLELEKLYCTGNKIKELDLRNNSKMKNLYYIPKSFSEIIRGVKILRPANNPELGNDDVHEWTDGLLFIWLPYKIKR